MSDLPDEDDEREGHEPPRKTNRLAWAAVVLMLVLVLVGLSLGGVFAAVKFMR